MRYVYCPACGQRIIDTVAKVQLRSVAQLRNNVYICYSMKCIRVMGGVHKIKITYGELTNEH